MNDSTALQVLSKEPTAVAPPMNASDIIAQVHLIQDVMKRVMKDKEHYGTIPGCGDKPALLKPGAEKLGMTFRLAPAFDEQVIDLGHGHREYRVKCTLTSIGGNVFIGQGIGSCSTMEAKYRFRTGPKTFTGKPVPKGFWDLRKENPAKAQEMIGGKGFGTAKNDSGGWEIVEIGEKVEHDNPADYYNTVWKMAKKRAHVDAILTATAASDIFAQDIDEMAEDGLLNPQPNKTTPTKAAPPPTRQNETAEENGGRHQAEAEMAMEKALEKHADNLSHGAGTVLDLEVKDGTKKNGQPWTRWGIKVGDIWLGTFDRKLGEKAESLRGADVDYSYKVSDDGKRKDLVSIDPL